MDVTLLGPQRRVAGARTAVAELVPEGPVATINAGWRERESDTAELDAVLGGRMVNLELYRRWHQLTEADSGYAEAEHRLTAHLEDLRGAHQLRLRQRSRPCERSVSGSATTPSGPWRGRTQSPAYALWTRGMSTAALSFPGEQLFVYE